MYSVQWAVQAPGVQVRTVFPRTSAWTDQWAAWWEDSDNNHVWDPGSRNCPEVTRVRAEITESDPSRWVNSSFPWIFPKLCNIMHEWGPAIRDYLITNQKSWVSPKNQVAGQAGRKLSREGEFCFSFLSLRVLIRKWGLRRSRSRLRCENW